MQRDVQLDLFTFAMSGKRLQGSLYGTTNSRTDIPLLTHLYRNGELKLDELITRATRWRTSTRPSPTCRTARTCAA